MYTYTVFENSLSGLKFQKNKQLRAEKTVYVISYPNAQFLIHLSDRLLFCIWTHISNIMQTLINDMALSS